MHVAWSLLISFIISLIFIKIMNLPEILGVFFSSKLLIIFTITPALILLVRNQLALQPVINSLGGNLTKAKTTVFILFLTSILLYSHIMARFGINPFGYFVFEYLVLFPFLLLLAPWFSRFSSIRLAEPDDEYAQFGYCLLRQKKFVWVEHKALILKSLVKVLFIPIMAGALFDAAEQLLAFEWINYPLVFISGLFIFGLTFDLTIATIGYVFASKLLNNDVKSTDPNLTGWLVCLICYPPLLIIYQLVKQQTDNFLWYDWLSVDQPLYWFWAFLITASWIIYWLSTASFGWRFSNLTWRGLVKAGPYAYTKHPAYIAKNIYWWMHTVPFYGVSTGYELVRNIAGLVFVSTIYYLRAKTEERHLMAFQEYREYANYIAKNGIFSKLTTLIYSHKAAK